MKAIGPGMDPLKHLKLDKNWKICILWLSIVILTIIKATAETKIINSGRGYGSVAKLREKRTIEAVQRPSKDLKYAKEWPKLCFLYIIQDFQRKYISL